MGTALKTGQIWYSLLPVAEQPRDFQPRMITLTASDIQPDDTPALMQIRKHNRIGFVTLSKTDIARHGPRDNLPPIDPHIYHHNNLTWAHSANQEEFWRWIQSYRLACIMAPERILTKSAPELLKS